MSNKFSIAAVLGLAAVPLLPQLAASTAGPETSLSTSSVPIEVVRSKPLPMAEVPSIDPHLQIAARRGRHRSDSSNEKARPDPTNDNTKTEPASEKDTAPPNSAATQSASEKKGAPSAPEAKTPVESTPENAQAQPPKPDVWSDAEIISALRECVRTLAPVAATVEIAEPVKQDQCGAPAPVMVRSLGAGENRVEINPPAMVNCAMVASLAYWVEHTLQPIAQETLGSPITRLHNASGYACRKRNGTAHNADRLSEHALANAIDIAGFVTADHRTIDVARYWGPTARDQREAEKKAAQAKDGNSAAQPEPAKEQSPIRKPSGIAHKASDRHKGNDRLALNSTELQKLGRGTSDAQPDPKAIPAPRSNDRLEVRKTAESDFLHRLHKSACGTFGTVLGPEANEAHRNHFHFDLAPRRHRSYCE